MVRQAWFWFGPNARARHVRRVSAGQRGSAERIEAAPGIAEAEEILASVWGHTSLRYHQRKAVLAALRKRDALVVLPTGGGKSLCFQLPALLRTGLTVVVSPLISLMQDQVGALRRRRVRAAYLSSTQPAEIRASVWKAVEAGRVRLLYVAPERLVTVGKRLRGKVTLLAVDEAHCISEWGHDFRPHYRQVGKARAALGAPPTMAVTATATIATRRDIAAVLRLQRPVEILSSFDRPNLRFGATCVRSEGERLQFAAKLVRSLSTGTTIIYVPTRDRADGTALIFRQWGFRVIPYHAGLPGRVRQELLERFLTGKAKVVVATSAFGMGIDKPDVRLVVHLGVPTRPESYYQEAGRAGRDGQPASCQMLWLPKDLELARRLGATGPGSAEALATMERYAKKRICRRQVLLGYLGESMPGHCGLCDVCDRS